MGPTGTSPCSYHYPPGGCANVAHGTQARNGHNRHGRETARRSTHEHDRWVGFDDRSYRCNYPAGEQQRAV